MSEKEKAEVSKEWYQKLLTVIYNNKNEEREMALDRYRRADEGMESNEHFIMMGKNAVAFLKQASDCTNSLSELAKEIKSIVYKEEEKSGNGSSFDESFKRDIINRIKEKEKENNLPEEDLE